MTATIDVSRKASPAEVRRMVVENRFLMHSDDKTQHGDILASDEEAARLLREAVCRGAMFYIGAFADNKSQRIRGNNLMRAKYIFPPYESYAVVADIEANNRVVTFIFLYAHVGDTTIVSVWANIANNRGLLLQAVHGFTVDTTTPQDAFYVLRGPAASHYDDTILTALEHTTSALLVILVLALNTKNVHVVVETPDIKLNKARVKSRKPPLPSYMSINADHITVVDADSRAKVEHQGGTHASPMPHIRRGHVRALPGGATTWVRDCLVNGKKGPPGSRMFYDVPGMAG